MFKPVHGIRGVLTQALTTFGTVMYVDQTTYALLSKRLPPGDHTYLILRTGYDYEIVKVTALTGLGVTIVRGIDGTNPLSLPIGTDVEFVLSESAITEIIEGKGLDEITLEGGGIITVDKVGVNHYSVSAPEITLVSESPNILVGGEFPNYTLSAPLLTDCCD